MIRLALPPDHHLGVPVRRWDGDAPLLRVWMDEDGKRGASYTAWELVVALACCPQVPEEAALRAWELAEKGEENER